MEAPQRFPETLFVGAALVGFGVLCGAAAGVHAQGAQGPISQAAGASVGGMLGGMVAAFGGLVVGTIRPKWQPLGSAASLIALGGLTAVAASAATKPGGVFGPATTEAPQVPQTTSPVPTA
jgi:hypothetical protein